MDNREIGTYSVHAVRKGNEQNKLHGSLSHIGDGGFATGYTVAFIWGINGIYTGAITFGVMTAFLQLVGQIQRPMVEMSRYIPSLVHMYTSSKGFSSWMIYPRRYKANPSF